MDSGEGEPRTRRSPRSVRTATLELQLPRSCAVVHRFAFREPKARGCVFLVQIFVRRVPAASVCERGNPTSKKVHGLGGASSIRVPAEARVECFPIIRGVEFIMD